MRAPEATTDRNVGFPARGKAIKNSRELFAPSGNATENSRELFAPHGDATENAGGNTFVDVSARSGILDQQGCPPGFEGSPTVTWAAAMVDYSLDGDGDIISADSTTSAEGDGRYR